MSSPISDIVDVDVSLEDPGSVTGQGFGKGLALLTHVAWTGHTKEYSEPADLLADGTALLTTDPIYVAASRYFDQEPAPAVFKVGRRQVNVLNITITVVNNFTYSVTINGTAYTYLSDGTAIEQEIVDGLIAAIAASPVTGSDGGANTLTVTADVAGTPFSCVVGANLAISSMTAAATIAADLDRINLNDPDFYGVGIVSTRTSADMQAVAAWVLTNKRLSFLSSQEADIVDVAVGSDSTTLPVIVKGLSNDRAVTFYHASANTNFIEFAAMGFVLARTPGSYTLALKTLLGIAVSALTPSQRTNALAKNANVFILRGGKNQVDSGKVASGKSVDQIHGRDWLKAAIQTLVFGLLSSVDKVPFDDGGIGQVKTKVQQAGQQGVDNTYLASVDSVTFPLKSAIPAGDVSARRLTGGKMTVTEAGAIESVVFKVNVQL